MILNGRIVGVHYTLWLFQILHFAVRQSYVIINMIFGATHLRCIKSV